MKLTELEKKIKWSKYYEIKDKNIWKEISEHKFLSEDFIREFADKLDWEPICYNQHLSMNFIREFVDKVDWYWIAARQNLTIDFIKEFEVFLKKYLYLLCYENPNLSKKSHTYCIYLNSCNK